MEVCDRDSVLTALGIESSDDLPVNCLTPEGEGYLNLRDLLNCTSEVTCQEALSELCYEGSGLLDGHQRGMTVTDGSSQQMKLGANDPVTENVSPLTGQMDLLSSRAPIFLEIKALQSGGTGTDLVGIDRDLLVQILDRIYRLRGTYGQLRKFVGFAATSRAAWCFLFSREEQDNPMTGVARFKESLSIWRIYHQDLFHIWASVATAASNDASWYLTRDAPFINSALMQLGYHPSLCGVKLEAASNNCSHKVYHLYLPKPFHSLSRNETLALSMNEPDLTVKVHRDSNDFTKEASCITRIRTKLSESEIPGGVSQSQFYAKNVLRFQSFPDPSMQPLDPPISQEERSRYATFLDNLDLRISQFPGEPSPDPHPTAIASPPPPPPRRPPSHFLCCPNLWNLIPLPAPLSEGSGGGVILMRTGRRASITQENIDGVILGVQKSLELIHLAGVCHCDIRPSNILEFSDGFQLIDYDQSVALGASFLFRSGALFDNRGYRLRGYEEGHEVRWTEIDDEQMLARFIHMTTRRFFSAIQGAPSEFVTPRKPSK